ncbi:hypothetical protein Tcan_10769 [Toxocara canis]|uniref:Uncharacterized protein n=1 Tax=Toxocara canis TaxID=6265 RepID=A0A0B2V2S0_TOXCA|nr:hypothetical protein Tcan_10769 [Toxocara canis]
MDINRHLKFQLGPMRRIVIPVLWPQSHFRRRYFNSSVGATSKTTPSESKLKSYLAVNRVSSRMYFAEHLRKRTRATVCHSKDMCCSYYSSSQASNELCLYKNEFQEETAVAVRRIILATQTMRQ